MRSPSYTISLQNPQGFFAATVLCRLPPVARIVTFNDNNNDNDDDDNNNNNVLIVGLIMNSGNKSLSTKSVLSALVLFRIRCV